MHADDIERMELDPLIGHELDGRWLVLEAIARGGMGTVYRGAHMELGRAAAIKVLSPTYAKSEEAVMRFLREARTTSRIDHPNIVPILDLGRLHGGAPYLVMELLEGEDLADLIAREAPVSASRVVDLLGPIARALDAVHGAGLLHRDVKPANIFLARRSDGAMSPTLIDFGLAALREAEDDGKLTRDGIVVGTPHYVSPEAAEGDPVDPRSDLYSLALVAFEMLTGLLPIDGAEAGSLLVQKVRKPAPTLSERTGVSYPPALEQIVARALSRTPDKRPSSAGAFIDALAEVAKEKEEASPPPPAQVEPLAPTPNGTFRPSEPAPTRRPLLGLWLGLLVVAGVTGLLMWSPWSTRDGMVARPLSRGAQPVREPEVPAPTPALAAAAPEVSPEASAAPERVDERTRTRRAARDRPAPAPATPSPPAPVRDTERAAALAREGGAALIRGRFARARELFRAATQVDETHAAAWRGLGLASERMGLGPEAARAYRRYLALAAHAEDADRVRERLARLSER